MKRDDFDEMDSPEMRAICDLINMTVEATCGMHKIDSVSGYCAFIDGITAMICQVSTPGMEAFLRARADCIAASIAKDKAAILDANLAAAKAQRIIRGDFDRDAEAAARRPS